MVNLSHEFLGMFTRPGIHLTGLRALLLWLMTTWDGLCGHQRSAQPFHRFPFYEDSNVEKKVL